MSFNDPEHAEKQARVERYGTQGEAPVDVECTCLGLKTTYLDDIPAPDPSCPTHGHNLTGETRSEESEQARREQALARFNTGERMVRDFQYRRIGGFYTALITAMHQADPQNFDRLRQGFPKLADAVHSWKYGDLAERLRDAGLMD